MAAGESLPAEVQNALGSESKGQSSPDANAPSAGAPAESRAATVNAAAKAADAAVLLPERADVLITDLLDHRHAAELPNVLIRLCPKHSTLSYLVCSYAHEPMWHIITSGLLLEDASIKG